MRSAASVDTTHIRPASVAQKSISARLLQAIKLSVVIFAWSESHRSIKYVVLMKIVKASGLVK